MDNLEIRAMIFELLREAAGAKSTDTTENNTCPLSYNIVVNNYYGVQYIQGETAMTQNNNSTTVSNVSDSAIAINGSSATHVTYTSAVDKMKAISEFTALFSNASEEIQCLAKEIIDEANSETPNKLTVANTIGSIIVLEPTLREKIASFCNSTIASALGSAIYCAAFIIM